MKSKFSTSRLVLNGLTWENYIINKYSKGYVSMKKVIISDCDGILTDGNMTYDENRKRFKTYGCHDKELYKIAKALGWDFRFVSDDRTGYNITDRRVSNFTDCHVDMLNAEQRKDLVEEYKEKGYLVVFLGDSPSDLNAASVAHICATTKNCFPAIKGFFHYVSEYEGGHGGFADILYNLILIDENALTKIYKI